MKKSVTIKDIAEQLNMSRNTVANALNGKYVPEKTRQAVIQKARELNYKQFGSVYFMESETVFNQKRILLLSGKPLNNMNFFTPILRGIENYSFFHHLDLFQYTFNASNQTFSSFSSYVEALNIDGIIALECFDVGFITKILNMNIPICFIDFSVHEPESDAPFDIVTMENSRSVYSYATYLIRKYKLEHLCFVGDYTHCSSFMERYQGMIQALAMEGIHHVKRFDILRSDNFNYGNAVAIKTEILKLPHLPDCFFCGNDFIARSTCNALRLMGLHVPSKCMVVGFDNVTEAYSVAPTITSFDSNNEQIGITAVETLINRIANPSTPKKIIHIDTRPIERTSTNR